MALGEPGALARPVDAGSQRPERTLGVADKSVAGRQVALSRYPQIACPRATRVGPMRAPVYLPQSEQQVGKGIALAHHGAAFEFLAAADHRLEHAGQAVVRHFTLATRSKEHWRKTHAVKAAHDEV